jgi:endonuclease/exonuclease/phosphatase (EEP) superfamily protein YafD
MFGWLSFVLHYGYWIVFGFAVAVGLAYVAFVLRNWKIAAAVAAIVFSIIAVQQIYSAGYHARIDEEVAARTRQLQDRLDTLQKAAEADRQRADEDAARIEDLQKQVSATPENKGKALPRDAANRIGGVR